MTITINGSTGITTPELTLDNTAADGGQVVLKSSGYSNWNLDNYSGRLRGYYGSTEYWTVDASGNVGIGTSSPAQSLDINRATDSRVRLLVNGTATGQIQAVSGDMRVHALGAIPLTFWTDSGERARIDSSGNLLVGTTTQKAKFTVEGSTSANYLIATNDTRSGADGASASVLFYRAGSIVGSIQTASSTTSYVTSSDYRLKENIAPMTGALSVVSALKPCTYTWKVDGSEGQGFIAHELAEVVPDCVTGEKDAVDADGNPKYQGIDTSFLVATLTAAIQELKAIVDEQAAKITVLENK